MGQLSLEEITEEANRRKARILSYMTQDPPVPFANIKLMEGMCDRACRIIVKEIEAEQDISYLGTPASKGERSELPFGLTSATSRLRARLGDHLHTLRSQDSSANRNHLATKTGLNPRAQLRAEQRPYTHDWTLSQIERLARELGENPMEFLRKCSTT